MRLAIVNDMPIGIEAMRRIVTSVPGYEVVWVAYNGAEAVEKCSGNRPDMILMDLLMPVMDGVEATRQIMANTPCAILIVTATVSGNISKVFEAMGFGALDAVCTPVFGTQGKTDGGKDLLNKIRMVGILLGSKNVAKKTPDSARIPIRRQSHPLIAIGASTGGPQAVAQILAGLPRDFKPAIVIVQHVDMLFAGGLADWLNVQSEIKVQLATSGTAVESGKAFLSCMNDHLVLNPDLMLSYTPDPKDYAYRPSVDVFFESAAKYWPGQQVAVLLTGMGRDGAQGLLTLREHKWHTIAQDKASCIVYGMPKAAAELDAAVEILPLRKIADRLVQLSSPATGQ